MGLVPARLLVIHRKHPSLRNRVSHPKTETPKKQKSVSGRRRPRNQKGSISRIGYNLTRQLSSQDQLVTVSFTWNGTIGNNLGLFIGGLFPMSPVNGGFRAGSPQTTWGFTSWNSPSGGSAGLKYRWRVHHYNIQIDIKNNEALVVSATALPIPSSMTGIMAANNYAKDLRVNPGAHSVTLNKAGVTGDQKTLVCDVDYQQLEGSIDINTSNYFGIYNTNPTNNSGIYLSCIVGDNSSTFTTAGLTFTCLITMQLVVAQVNQSLDG